MTAYRLLLSVISPGGGDFDKTTIYYCLYGQLMSLNFTSLYIHYQVKYIYATFYNLQRCVIPNCLDLTV